MSTQSPSAETNNQQHPQRAGQWFLFIIGLFLVLIGSVFIWLMIRSYLRAHEMKAWPEVPCTILTSEVAERRHDAYSPVEYRHMMSYGYEWHGKTYTNDAYSLRGSKWSSSHTKALEDVKKFPVGSRRECHVNPDNPEQAVIKTDSLAPLYSIWFPALFVVGGLGIMTRVVLRRSRE